MQQSKPLEFLGTPGGYFVLFIVSLVSAYIPVVGWAFGFNFAAEWFTDNTLVNGSKVKYQAGFGETLKFVLVNVLLIMVTLGIYVFWFYPKMFHYIFEHTHYLDAAAAPAVPAPMVTDTVPPAPLPPTDPVAPVQPIDVNQPPQPPVPPVV